MILSEQKLIKNLYLQIKSNGILLEGQNEAKVISYEIVKSTNKGKHFLFKVEVKPGLFVYHLNIVPYNQDINDENKNVFYGRVKSFQGNPLMSFGTIKPHEYEIEKILNPQPPDSEPEKPDTSPTPPIKDPDDNQPFLSDIFKNLPRKTTYHLD